jgi:hypothetical protein
MGSRGRSIVKAADGAPLEISAYADDLAADPTELLVHVRRLRAAFPQMDDNFYNILVERIVANKFTRQRLADAVNYVIDNVRYKELHVADIVGFDRRIKLYPYNELTCLVTEGIIKFDDICYTVIDGRYCWFKKADATYFKP